MEKHERPAYKTAMFNLQFSALMAPNLDSACRPRNLVGSSIHGNTLGRVPIGRLPLGLHGVLCLLHRVLRLLHGVLRRVCEVFLRIASVPVAYTCQA